MSAIEKVTFTSHRCSIALNIKSIAELRALITTKRDGTTVLYFDRANFHQNVTDICSVLFKHLYGQPMVASAEANELRAVVKLLCIDERAM